MLPVIFLKRLLMNFCKKGYNSKTQNRVRGKEIDVRPYIKELAIASNKPELRLHMLLQNMDGRGCKPAEVIQALLHLSDDEISSVMIKRTGLYILKNGEWQSPMDENVKAVIYA